MPGRISELLPKKRSRLQMVLEHPESIDMESYFRDVQDMRNAAADWTSIDDALFRRYIGMADDLVRWYAVIWLPEHTDYPASLWEIWTSQDMADLLAAYLQFRMAHTVGRHPSGKIRVKTLTAWSKQVLYVAAYNLIGRGRLQGPRQESVMTGTLPDRSDSLWALLRGWCHAYSAKHDLPHQMPLHEYFGPPEAALIIRRLEQKMIQSPQRAAVTIQTKAAINMMLCTGVRPSALGTPAMVTSTNAMHFLEESSIAVSQPHRGVYDVEVDFRWLKGFSSHQHEISNFRPVLPAVTKVRNLQHEVASTLIPMLVHRQVLCCRTRDGEYIFRDMSDFLESDARHFYVTTSSTDALFRQSDTHGDLSKKPLRAADIQRRMLEVALEIRLPNARAYAFRRNFGDIAMITQGTDGQRVALNHYGRDHDAGRVVYSHGVSDMNLPRVILGEFGTGDEDAQRRLHASRYYDRQTDSRAVQTMLRLHRQGFYRLADAIARPSDEELSEELDLDPQYKRLDDVLTAVAANPNAYTELQHDIKEIRRRWRELRRNAEKRIQGRKGRALRRQNELGQQAVDGTILQYRIAKSALDGISSSLPLILTHHNGDTLEDEADFEAFWQAAERTAYHDTTDDDPNVWRFEDEGMDLDSEDTAIPAEDELMSTTEASETLHELLSDQTPGPSISEVAKEVAMDNAIHKLKRKVRTESPVGKLAEPANKIARRNRAGVNVSLALKRLETGDASGNDVGNGHDSGRGGGENERDGETGQDDRSDDGTTSSTTPADRFLEDLRVYDDRYEPVEPDDLNIVQYRRQYMLQTFRLIQGQPAQPSQGVIPREVREFIMAHGWCPFCPPGELGMSKAVRDSLGRVTNNGHATGILHNDHGPYSVGRRKIYTQHIPRCHPEIDFASTPVEELPVMVDGGPRKYGQEMVMAMAQVVADARELRLPTHERPSVEDMADVIRQQNEWLRSWSKK
nr:uncharacterized protein CI109_004550 [Kwoniella shandongensis]KAA5527015.1 hypothetical protein CI109_004550 [Kwoniella shandongensis]